MKDIPGHIFITLHQKSFFEESFKIGLPERVFPKRFEFEDVNSYITGYFANYESNFNRDEILEYCQKGNWSDLANSNNDFLIIYFDKKEKKISVLIDQSEKFGLYFANIGNRLVLSTGFSTIFRQIVKPVVDLDSLFTMIDLRWHKTEKTVIKQIQQLPGATLLIIDSDLVYQLMPLTNLNKFLEEPIRNYHTPKHFIVDFLELFKTIIKSQTSILPSIPIAADLSSGFDCTLVSYFVSKFLSTRLQTFSGCSSITQEDTNVPLMKQFAQLHNFSLHIFDYEDRFSGNFPEWKYWQARDILQLKAGRDFAYHKDIADSGFPIKYNGWGGDEVYASFGLDVFGPFPIQEDFFAAIKKSRAGLEKLLTKPALDLYTSWIRFQSRTAYHQIIAPTATFCCRYLSDVAWELGLWPMTPFIDTRLIQFCRNIPKKSEEKFFSKQELLHLTEGIFPKEMWVQKGGMENVIMNFLNKNSRFIKKLLSESRLAEANFLEPGIIINQLEKGTLKISLDDESANYLYQIILIEYFLQQNNLYLKL